MTAPRIIKTCLCGATYDRAAWRRLKYIGIQDDVGPGPGMVGVLRDCATCGSTIAIRRPSFARAAVTIAGVIVATPCLAWGVDHAVHASPLGVVLGLVALVIAGAVGVRVAWLAVLAPLVACSDLLGVDPGLPLVAAAHNGDGGTDAAGEASDDGAELGDAHADVAQADDAPADTSIDSGADAPAPVDAGPMDDAGWTVEYRDLADPNYGTTFARTSSGPAGSYTGTCVSVTQSAAVAAAGSDYVVTPQPGCYEDAGDPCIDCSRGCASATPVLLVGVPNAGAMWRGACGEYTVTLRGQ